MRFLKSLVCVLFFHTSLVAQQLVLPGDHPDPSVVKIGNTFWASATTSNWAPAYPLYYSNDLIHWQSRGAMFPTLPDWADYYFWAPEITYDNGKVWVYYAAHKRGGNLCIGIAEADKPEGPYKDHGPIVCQADGSIDAFPMRDENGKLYLIWKEDANSIGKPTPIWAQQLNEERTALVGEKQELFRNTLSWEGNLVEGVAMIKHGKYFYAIYAAAACCGRECNYVTGVARSKNLLGPWEKQDKPLLTGNEYWKCPGHGTTIEKDGRYYFLHHAYNRTSNVYVGREGLLTEFRFTSDGWIEVVPNQTTTNESPSSIRDAFNEKIVSDNWEWSVFQKPIYKIKHHALELNALAVASGAFMAQKTMTANYEASIQVRAKKSNAAAGLAAIGDDNNLIAVLLRNDRIQLVQVKDGKDSVLLEQRIRRKSKVDLYLSVRNGKDLSFGYRLKGANPKWLNTTPIDGTYLPPWDRGVRVGLISKGTSEEKAVFKKFALNSH